MSERDYPPCTPRGRQAPGRALPWQPVWWLLAALPCMLVCALCCQAAHAAPADGAGQHQPAQDIAQTVLGISSYARWPVPHAELQLCVVGTPRYADTLLQSELATASQTLHAQRMGWDSPAMASGCDIVYLGALDQVSADKLYAQIGNKPILSISEPTASCSVGSMFCLRFRDSQVAFDVNLDAIARSGLRVHPNVLLLGRRKAAP